MRWRPAPRPEPHSSPTCCHPAHRPTSASCSTTPRIPPVVERGGAALRGRGRRRYQPHPPRPRTRPRHPAHRMPDSGHRAHPPPAPRRPPTPGRGGTGDGLSVLRRPPRPLHGRATGRLLPGHPRRPRPALLHLRFHRCPEGRDLHPGPPGGGGKVPGRKLRGAPGRRALHLHADVPRQRGDRRLGARAGGRGGGGAAPAVLGVTVPGRRTGVQGHVLHLCRPCRAVRPGHRKACRRPGQPAAHGLRHGGGSGGRGSVRPAVRGAAGGGVRVLGGRGRGAVVARDTGRGGRAGGARARRTRPRDACRMPARGLRLGRAAAQRGSGDRGVGEPRAQPLRGVLAQSRGGRGTAPGGLVLDR